MYMPWYHTWWIRRFNDEAREFANLCHSEADVQPVTTDVQNPNGYALHGTQEPILSPLQQNLGQPQDETYSLVKMAYSLQEPLRSSPFLCQNILHCTLDLRFMGLPPGVMQNKSKSSLHDGQMYAESIIFLKSYLSKKVTSHFQHHLRTFSSSTNILYYLLRELQLISHAFWNKYLPSQKQTVGNLAQSVTPECLITFTDIKNSFFPSLSLLSYFWMLFFISKNDWVPLPVWQHKLLCGPTP